MGADFNAALDNFLAERMGEDIARLKKIDQAYNAALTECSELQKKACHNELDDYRQAFARLSELTEYIRDTESKYLFYAGMATRQKIDEAVLSFLESGFISENNF